MTHKIPPYPEPAGGQGSYPGGASTCFSVLIQEIHDDLVFRTERATDVTYEKHVGEAIQKLYDVLAESAPGPHHSSAFEKAYPEKLLEILAQVGWLPVKDKEIPEIWKKWVMALIEPRINRAILNQNLKSFGHLFKKLPYTSIPFPLGVVELAANYSQELSISERAYQRQTWFDATLKNRSMTRTDFEAVCKSPTRKTLRRYLDGITTTQTTNHRRAIAKALNVLVSEVPW